MPRNPLKTVSQWDVKAPEGRSGASRSASPRRKESRSRGRSSSSGSGSRRGPPRGGKGKGKGRVQVCFAHNPRKGRTCRLEHCHRLHLDTTDPDQEQRYLEAIASWEAYKEAMDLRGRSRALARSRSARRAPTRSRSARGRSVPARRHPFTARRRHERSGTRSKSRGASSRKAAEELKRKSPSYSPERKRKGGKKDRSRSRRPSKSRKPARAPRAGAGGDDGGRPGQLSLDGETLSFRGFLRTQKQSMPPDEAISAYSKYKEEHQRQKAERFFSQHCDSGLLGDLYSPQSVLRAHDWQRVCLHRAAAAFHKELDAGHFEELSLRFAPDGADELELELGGAGLESTSLASPPGLPPHFLLDPEACSMTLKGVEPALSVWDFHEVLHQLPGFLDVWMERAGEEPQLRTCHAGFDSEAHLDAAIAAVAGVSVKTYALQPAKAPRRRELRVLLAPEAASQPRQLQADLELAAALVTKLDAAAGLPEEGTQRLLQEKVEQAEAQLDLRVHYLRSVHRFCFYSGKHASDARELAKECGAACLRRCGEARTAGDAGAWAAAHNVRLRQALAMVSEAAKPMLSPPSLEEEPLRSRWAEHCAKNMKQESEGRHRCLVCSKLFKGPEYVVKHLLKAHGQTMQDLIADIMKERMHDAFMSAGKGPGWH